MGYQWDIENFQIFFEHAHESPVSGRKPWSPETGDRIDCATVCATSGSELVTCEHVHGDDFCFSARKSVHWQTLVKHDETAK
jgi:hypothetical protein